MARQMTPMELEAAKQAPLVGAEARGGDASELALTLNLVTACRPADFCGASQRAVGMIPSCGVQTSPRIQKRGRSPEEGWFKSRVQLGTIACLGSGAVEDVN